MSTAGATPDPGAVRADMAGADPARAWHPVAAVHDLPYRHVFHGQLLGRELAIWRADDGYVNAWENRCLHRGVRLSIGVNDGRELKCQYHGWRYANRTAGCTYIPAHPADAPARTICNRTFPAVERHGLVWSGEAPEGDVPDHCGFPEPLALRGIAVNAPPGLVAERLAGYRFLPCGRLDADNADIDATVVSPWAVRLNASVDGDSTGLLLLVQPVDSHRSVIRGVVDRGSGGATDSAILRHHNGRLGALRDAIESEAAELEMPEPLEPTIERLPPDLAEIPEPPKGGRQAALRVEVARKWHAAKGICGFRLVPVSGTLPTFQPGAHVDVHMPNGLIRQYSLVNGPGETDGFVIGVKLEPESAGGSLCMHEAVREGDVLAVSEPRNNFTLRRDATRSLLIAGGIGITPLLSMARTLDHGDLGYELHYFAQNEEQVAFRDILDGLGDRVRLHLGLGAAETGAALDRLLAGREDRMHVYLCGPGPMLEAARRAAEQQGWPDEAVHFEYFANPNKIDDSSSFEIDLARSCMTLQVAAGRTILEVLRENGVDLPSSCEQGACGTCAVPVLEGQPDHQDVYLSDAEKAAGDRIMTCVSRAGSDRLVLDI